jgi:predicted ABC-type ATPase
MPGLRGYFVHVTLHSAPSIVVVGGPNGAGKTTAAPFLLRDALGVREYVNADPIAAGLSAFAPESVAIAAGRVMLARLDDLARQLALARVARRVELGGHSVPADVVRRRYAAGLRNFFGLYRPIVSTWQVFDNSDLPAPRLIAMGEGSSTIVYQADLWASIVRQWA